MLRGMTIYDASDGTVMTDIPSPQPEPALPADVIDAETVDEPTAAPAEAEPAAPEAGDDDDAVDAEVVDDVVVAPPVEPGQWKHDPAWPHDSLLYHGDLLAVRIPNSNALTALYQSSRSCSEEFQVKLMEKFVKTHLSEQSIERVLERMADPDDEAFATGMTGWSDLMRSITDIGGQRALKAAKELSALQSGKRK